MSQTARIATDTGACQCVKNKNLEQHVVHGGGGGGRRLLGAELGELGVDQACPVLNQFRRHDPPDKSTVSVALNTKKEKLLAWHTCTVERIEQRFSVQGACMLEDNGKLTDAFA